MPTNKELAAKLAEAMKAVAANPEFRAVVQETVPNNGTKLADILEINHRFQKEHPERFEAARKGLYAI